MGQAWEPNQNWPNLGISSDDGATAKYGFLFIACANEMSPFLKIR
jgi:hypothetical protein